jgi:hypothetical protein
MAYIQQRGEYWRVEIRRRGHKPVYHTFGIQQQTEQCARRIEAGMDARSHIDKSEAERTTLRDSRKASMTYFLVIGQFDVKTMYF